MKNKVLIILAVVFIVLLSSLVVAIGPIGPILQDISKIATDRQAQINSAARQALIDLEGNAKAIYTRGSNVNNVPLEPPEYAREGFVNPESCSLILPSWRFDYTSACQYEGRPGSTASFNPSTGQCVNGAQVKSYGSRCNVDEYIALYACDAPNSTSNCQVLFNDAYRKEAIDDNINLSKACAGGNCYDPVYMAQYGNWFNLAIAGKYIGYDCQACTGGTDYTCDDPDSAGGTIPLQQQTFEKGTTTIYDNSVYFTSATDTCLGDNVREYSCSSETTNIGQVDYQTFVCENGCVNGACLPLNECSLADPTNCQHIGPTCLATGELCTDAFYLDGETYAYCDIDDVLDCSENQTGLTCIDNQCAEGTPTGTCYDGVKNRDEDAIDCGGQYCTFECNNPVLCTDGRLDGYEEGLDCGGQYCDACEGNVFQTCDDGLKNNGETDIDCGGPACDACPLNSICVLDSDCIGDAYCKDNWLIADRCTAQLSCTDELKNNGESDVDCGGPACEPCDEGQVCTADTDCSGDLYCLNIPGVNRVCTVPDPTYCNNFKRDNQETDDDCGGPNCESCSLEKLCKVNGDCISGYCSYSLIDTKIDIYGTYGTCRVDPNEASYNAVVDPTNRDYWCLIDPRAPNVTAACKANRFPRKTNVFISDIESEISDVESEIVDLNAKMNSAEGVREFIKSTDEPLCFNSWGNAQCSDGGKCIAAKNSNAESNVDKLRIYDAIYDNLIEAGYADWFIWLQSPENKEAFVEKYGACITDEEEDALRGIKQWLGDLFGLDPNDPLVLVIGIGGVVLIIVLISMATRPPRQR